MPKFACREVWNLYREIIPLRHSEFPMHIIEETVDRNHITTYPKAFALILLVSYGPKSVQNDPENAYYIRTLA